MTPEMNEQPKCPQCGRVLPPGALEGLCPACLLKQGHATESGSQPGQTPFEPLPVADVGRLFPQLEILELIGKGGMGAIYKARQANLDRFVALKLLPAQRSGGPNFAERFNREARALARLSHPNIVAVHEFGQVNGLHYFLMEFVDGVNLRQLQRAGRLSPRQGLEIVPQICDALQYAHDEGVVHRDIKPENILIDRRGRVKIADFGLAKILGSDPDTLRLTGEGHVMGTPHYMAPEQVEHPLEVDHRADIYALGVVFYEMLTGELPLGKFAPPSCKVQLDVRLDEVVLRALEKEPDRRYQQASQVKTAVETVTQAPQPNSTEPSPTPTQSQPSDMWRRIQYRFWPPLVGRRGGQRVINWPALAMRGARGLLVWLAVGFVLAVGMASLAGPKPGLVTGAVLMGISCILIPAILGIRVLRGFATPLDLLPELDQSASWLSPTALCPEETQGKRRAAVIAGMSVFLVVVIATGALTFALPKMYMSVARIQVQPATPNPQEPVPFDPYFIQTEMEKLRSMEVAHRVAERLNLKREWAGRFGAESMSTREAAIQLNQRLDLRQTRNTWLIEIRFYSESAGEAAEIANAVAETSREMRPNHITIVDRAEPSRRPVRPNVPLNLALGVGAGALLGLITAGIVLLTRFLSVMIRQHRKGSGENVPPLQRRTVPLLIAALVVVAGLGLFTFVLLDGWLGLTWRDVTVTGTVSDANTGQLIPGARVADNRYGSSPGRAPRETWTDAKGRFALTTSYEEHTIAASAPGYEPRVTTLLTKTFGHQDIVNLDFQLKPTLNFGASKEVLPWISNSSTAKAP